MFVKAVGAELNPESPDLHRREAVVSAALPPSPRFPRLLDAYDDGDWVALAFEAVDGRPPHAPVGCARAGDGGAPRSMRLHDELTPSPVPVLEPLADPAAPLFGGWADAGRRWPRRPAALDPWARRHLERLAELESGWPEPVPGSTLLHGDVRADNVLLTADGVVFVDWPHAAVGTPVFDLVAWAPSVVLEGGPEPEELLALSPVRRPRRPRRRHGPARRVRRLLRRALAPAGAARAARPCAPSRRAQGAVALAWLRRRTGW